MWCCLMSTALKQGWDLLTWDDEKDEYLEYDYLQLLIGQTILSCCLK